MHFQSWKSQRLQCLHGSAATVYTLVLYPQPQVALGNNETSITERDGWGQAGQGGDVSVCRAVVAAKKR